MACPLLQTLQFGANGSTVIHSQIKRVTIIGTPPMTGPTYMFANCYELRSIVGTEWADGISDFTGMFYNCYSLAVGALSGTQYAISYASCVLSAAELDSIYTNLGTAAGAQTITVTGNYGTTGDTPSIATAKGWTVTG